MTEPTAPVYWTVVAPADTTLERLERYLYDHTKVIGQTGDHYLLKTTSNAVIERTKWLAEYQSGRLESGLFACSRTFFDTPEAALRVHEDTRGVAIKPLTVRVLVALDIPAAQAADREDLIDSIHARLADEAGYLDAGDPIVPTEVVVTIVDDDTPIDAVVLGGIYEVGVDGVPV